MKDDEVKAYMNTLKAIVEAKPDSISIHVPQALLWLRDLGYTGAIEPIQVLTYLMALPYKYGKIYI